MTRITLPTPPAPTVQTDLLCAGCDYNLRFQPLNGNCPECGRAVAKTLTDRRIGRKVRKVLAVALVSAGVIAGLFILSAPSKIKPVAASPPMVIPPKHPPNKIRTRVVTTYTTTPPKYSMQKPEIHVLSDTTSDVEIKP